MDKSRVLLLALAWALITAPASTRAQALAPLGDEEEEEEDDTLGEDYVPGASGSPTLKPPSVLDEPGVLDLEDEEDEEDEGEEPEDIFGQGAEDLLEEATAEQGLPEQKETWAEETTKFFEASGYFRLRADLFHKFDMGFPVNSGYKPFDRPLEQTNQIYYGSDTQCTQEGKKPKWCRNRTLAGANIRLRFNPIINLSENVRILASFDILDNLVLGSTPEGGGSQLGMDGFGLGPRNPWVPLEAFSGTQDAPSWRNTMQNAISVRAVWGEVLLKNIGMLKFGRMPSHFGMGLLANDGSGIDDDYGDTADRVLFATKLFSTIFAVGWDFPASGPTSMKWSQQSGQAYDASQVDDVNQWLLVVAYKQEREEEERLLSLGKPAFAAGLYALYRTQVLSSENWNWVGASTDNVEFVRRDAWAVIADLWFRMLIGSTRLELEGVIIGGKIANIEQDQWIDEGYDILQWGLAFEFEQRFLDDSLYVLFKAGYASGDPNVEGLTPNDGLLVQQEGKGDHRISAFRFDPDYNIDLILFEQLMGQVGSAYYFRPSIGYWFLKNTLVAQLDIIYSLASEPVSTNGNSPHLGVEFDLTLRYQTKDHFIAMLQYAYLVPLPGFQDLSGLAGGHRNLSHPQTLQGYLGIVF
jgi:uncharacterized protein (TIGR04551 family)